MSKRRSSRKVNLLEDNSTILSNYLAPALFSETNLPQVRVSSIRPNGLKVYHPPEDVEIVLSLYGLGKVTFRHDYEHGGVIPVLGSIRIPSTKSYLRTTAVLDDRILTTYNLKMKGSPPIPHNLERYIEYLRGNLKEKTKDSSLIMRGVYYLRPLKISIPHFYYHDGKGANVYLHWKLWRGSLTITSKIYFPKSKSLYGREIAFLDSKTTAYPLIFTHFIGEYPSSSSDALAKLQEVLVDGPLKLVYRTVDVLKGVYSYDIHYNVKEIDHQRLQIIQVNKEDELVAPKDVRGWRCHYSTSKVLFRRINTKYIPCILCYDIEETNALKVKFRELKEFKDFIDFAYSNDFYRKTVHDVILNFYLHILSGDLRLKELFPKNLLEILKTSLTWKELFSKKILIEDIWKRNITKEVLEFFREALEELNELCKDSVQKLRVKLFLSLVGRSTYIYGDLIKVKRDEIDKIFKKILDDYKNLHNIEFILERALLHSFSHYLLSMFIKESGSNDIAIQEAFPSAIGVTSQTYYNMHDLFTDIAIYEASSGGLGLISSVLENLSNKIDLFINDLLVKPGECLIGTPEDLIYHYLLLSSSYNSLEKALESLNIIVTKDEFYEAQKLLKSLLKEASSLSTHMGMKVDHLRILHEVIKARKSFEDTYKRTPTVNEMTLWLIKGLNNYQSIRNVVLTLSANAFTNYWLKALKNRYKEGVNAITRYFNELISKYGNERGTITIDSIDKDKVRLRLLLRYLIHDVMEFLDKGHSLLSEVYEKLSGDEKKAFSKAIIYLLQQLRGFITSLFYRLYLLTCYPACGWCLLNTKGCSITQTSEAQILFLNRRLLKIFFSYLARQLKGNIAVFDEQDQVPSDYEVICAAKIGERALKYCIRVSDHES